jgi:acetyl esterase/lipase
MVGRPGKIGTAGQFVLAERVVVSPLGQAAAMVVQGPADGGAEISGLWYGPLDGHAQRIASEIADTNVAFSPDGRALAIGVQHGPGSLLIIQEVPEPGGRLGPGAGPACRRSTHRMEGFAERIAWTDEALVVLCAEAGADSAALASGKPLTGAEADPVVTRTEVGWRRLWALDPDTDRAPVAVSPEGLTVWEFSPLRGGGFLAVCSAEPGESGWYHSDLVVFGSPPESWRVLHTSRWQLSSPTVSPDGRRAAFIEGWASDRGLVAGDVRVVDLASGRVSPRFELGADVTDLSWADGGRLWFAGWHHLGTAWGSIGGAGGMGGVPGGDTNVALHLQSASCLNARWHPGVVPLPDGTALTVRSTAEQPPEVVRLDPAGSFEPWTAFNEGLSAERRLRLTELRWPGPGGIEIEGLFAAPVGEVPGPWPMVVDIHGGPSLAWHHSWGLTWAEVLTAAGYGVLMANPRGSAGRGQLFARSNLTDPAGAEFEDIVAGVRHCVAEGLADPDRVAAIGASYGGYLTAWGVAGGKVFRCGVVIAGLSDLVSARGTANNAAFYDEMLGGTPKQAGSLYLERSPVTMIGPGSAPALVLHGALDRCVPEGQAQELYRALHDAGVEVELVVYPREGHQVQEPAHLADQRQRVIRWLNTHLGNGHHGATMAKGSGT